MSWGLEQAYWLGVGVAAALGAAVAGWLIPRSRENHGPATFATFWTGVAGMVVMGALLWPLALAVICGWCVSLRARRIAERRAVLRTGEQCLPERRYPPCTDDADGSAQ